MSFLDAEVDLSGTICTQAQLEWARDYLVELIASEDPAWLKNPVGYLARFWLADNLNAVCSLTDFARILYWLETGGLDLTAKPVLLRKFQNLLRKTHKREAFEESLTELQVAALLSERFRPVLLEPRILELKPGERPCFAPVSGSKLLDMALILEGEALFVEVTVIHSEIFNQWAKGAAALAKAINLTLWLEEIQREVKLKLPFPLPDELSKVGKDEQQITSFVLDKITTQSEGKARVTIAGKGSKTAIELEWNENSFKKEGVTEEIGFRQGAVSCAIAGEDFPALREVGLKSLRNSLQIKREQFQLNIPFVLVIRPGNPLLPDWLWQEIIEKRLWTNPRFTWLSAIAIFRPRAGYRPVDPGPSFLFSPNPEAKFPAGKKLQGVFSASPEI